LRKLQLIKLIISETSYTS